MKCGVPTIYDLFDFLLVDLFMEGTNQGTIQMKTKMNRKLLIFQIVWFVAFILTLQFYRFKFGIFKTGVTFVIIGILGAWLLSCGREKNSNKDTSGKR